MCVILCQRPATTATTICTGEFLASSELPTEKFPPKHRYPNKLSGLFERSVDSSRLNKPVNSILSSVIVTMLRGNLWTEGAPILSNLVFLLAFFTVIMAAAQEDKLPVPPLDIFQTIAAWPSFNEGAILTVVLWCFRAIERILGSKLLAVFLLYNLLVFLPLFGVVIWAQGFGRHFSLFFFVPFAFYVYAIWNLPATPMLGGLPDKLLLTLLIAAELVLEFPWAFGALAAGILGNVVWAFDCIRMKKLCETTESVRAVENVVVVQPSPEAEREIDPDQIRTITDMGFSDAQAAEALRNSGGDVQRAVDALLEGLT
jgi:hypothetical protein